MEIGAKLRQARIAAGLTQEQTAEALGVSRQAVSRWESGRSYPEVDKILYICNRYQVSLDELFSQEVPREAPVQDAPKAPLPEKTLKTALSAFFANLAPREKWLGIGAVAVTLALALVLGLYLVLPARAADSGPVLLLPGASGPAAETVAGYRCADFLEEAGLKPEGLEYLFCRPAAEPRTGRRTLTARYRVPGPQAVTVEHALRERTGMAALERQMGIWQLPEGGEGRFVLRQTAGADSTGVALPAPFLSVEGLRDGLSAADTAGDNFPCGTG